MEAKSKNMQTNLNTLLKKHFGYSSFRPKQREIIEDVLGGKDVIVLMPTGGGKSICFQLPTLALGGCALIISPLISLMKDQVDQLRALGLKAEYYNSSLSESEKRDVIDQLKGGQLQFIYSAPETLYSPVGQEILAQEYALIAIDEAHCVSMWGHDFRPEYTQLSQLRGMHPKTPFMALTATADKLTKWDIAKHLGLKEPVLHQSSFDRPNIHLSVRGNMPKSKKMADLQRFLRSHEDESGIIYCLSRRETEEMVQQLDEWDISAQAYHAGLDAGTRAKVQEDFINDDLQIVCATIAFGMGIDKSNVRWVVHNNLPKNVEGYYQEIGRSGRDGDVAEALLYYNYRDVKLLSDFAKQGEQTEVMLEKLNRMVEFAEATSCRRRILLSYFSEDLRTDCENCDVCQNPRKKIDGTRHSQMAISAVMRAKEKLSTNLLIDVLRGAKTAQIFSEGLNKIKTYGVGSENSWKEWHYFIREMKNQGIFEIAYNENMHLKATPFAQDVVAGKSTVTFAEYIEEEPKKKRKTKKKKVEFLSEDEMLFDRLKLLRKQLAVEANIPPYLIFSDASLKDMSAKTPRSIDDFMDVSGVGEAKADRYGKDFMKLIDQFAEAEYVRTVLHPEHKKKLRSKGSSVQSTCDLFQEGKTPEEIATERNMSESTIWTHLSTGFKEKKLNDWHRLVSPAEIKKVEEAVVETGGANLLKPIYDFLNESLSYDKIRIALLYLDQIDNQENELSAQEDQA